MANSMELFSKDELAAVESGASAEEARLLALVVEQQEIIAAVKGERQRRINELRRCRTPEEFAAKGFELTCIDRDYTEGSEYRTRLKNGLPLMAPKLKVGDWAYNPLVKVNARVVRIIWEAPVAFCIGGWRYSIPGYSSYDAGGAREKAPYVEYTTTGDHCYTRVQPEATS